MRMDDDWGNGSLTPSENSSSSLFEHVESQKKRSSVKADWLELRNNLFQSRAVTEREEERLERERQEQEKEWALQQEEARAQAFAEEAARLDALDDGSDIPPWHRSGTKDGKPSWLIELLVKVAQREDADEAYQQYKSWPVKQELEGIKQAYELMDNSQKIYKTPHALPPRRETEVFREGILLKQQGEMGGSGDEMEEEILEEEIVEIMEEEEEILEDEEVEEILDEEEILEEEEEEILEEQEASESEYEMFMEETVHFIEETVHVVETDAEEEILEDSDDEDSFYEEEEIPEMSSSSSADDGSTLASDLTSHSSDEQPASPEAPKPVASKKVLSPLEMLEQMSKTPPPTKKVSSRKSTRKSTSKRKSQKKKESRPSYNWKAHSEKKPSKQSTSEDTPFGKVKLKPRANKAGSPNKASPVQPSKLNFSKTPEPKTSSKPAVSVTAPKSSPVQKSPPVKAKEWQPKQTPSTTVAQGSSSTVKAELAKWQKPAVTRDQLRSSIVKTKLESKQPLKKSPVPVTKDDLRSSIVQSKLKNKPVLRKPSFSVSSKELKTNVVQEKLVNKPKWKKPAVSVTKDELKKSSVHEKLVNKPKWKRPPVSVTKDELTNSSVHSKLKNKPLLKRPSFSPTKVELKSSKPQTKLKKKAPVKKPAVAVTKDQLKSSKVQAKLSNKPTLRKSSFSVSSKELQASAVKDKLENKPKWRRPSLSVTKDELKGSKVQTKLSNRPILRKPSFAVSTKDLRGSIVQDKLAKKPDITKISSPVKNVKLVSMKNKLKKTPLPPLAPKPSGKAAQEKPKWMEKTSAKDATTSERNSNSQATVKAKDKSNPEGKPVWAKETKTKNTTTNDRKGESEVAKPKADSQAPWTNLKLKPSISVPNIKGSATGKLAESKLSISKDRQQGNKEQARNWKALTAAAPSAKPYGSNQEQPNWMQQRTLVLQKTNQSATKPDNKGSNERGVKSGKGTQAANNLRRSSISVPNLKGSTARKRHSLTHSPSGFANAKDWLQSKNDQNKVATKPDPRLAKGLVSAEDMLKIKRRSSLSHDLVGPSSVVSSANSSCSSLNGDDKPAWVERALAMQRSSRSSDSDEGAL